MARNYFFHKCQSETRAGFSRLFRAARTVKLSKDVFDFFLVHAVATVFDRYADISAVMPGLNGDRSLCGRVFDSVRDQIIASAFEKLTVAPCEYFPFARVADFNLLSIRQRTSAFHACRQQIPGVHGGILQLNFARRELFDTEKHFDHTAETLRLAMN